MILQRFAQIFFLVLGWVLTLAAVDSVWQQPTINLTVTVVFFGLILHRLFLMAKALDEAQAAEVSTESVHTDKVIQGPWSQTYPGPYDLEVTDAGDEWQPVKGTWDPWFDTVEQPLRPYREVGPNDWEVEE